MQLFSPTKLKHKGFGAPPFITLQIKIHLCRLISVFCQLSDWNPTLLISKECMLHTVFLWKAHFKMPKEISNNSQVLFSLPYYGLFTKKMQWQTGQAICFRVQCSLNSNQSASKTTQICHLLPDGPSAPKENGGWYRFYPTLMEVKGSFSINFMGYGLSPDSSGFCKVPTISESFHF